MDKRIISFLAVFFLGLAAFQPALTASTPEYNYQIEVTDTTFLPSAIYEGDIVTLEVSIKNRATETQLADIEAELELGDQFRGINTVDSIDYILSGETKALVFKFQAKEGISPGYYSLPLTINYSSAEDTLKQTHVVLAPISKVDKNLDITIEPNVINPGKPTEVVFTIKNVGNTPVSNISLSWAEENNLVLPLGSDNKRYITILPANQAAEVSYTITADPNITPGVYPLDISVTFNDANGIRTQASNIGMIIGGKTDFEISAELMSNNQLSISIANIGSNNAYALVVKIPEQDKIGVNGSNISILGNLNKGDFTLANFEVTQRNTQMRPGSEGFASGQITQETGQTQGSGRGNITIQVDYTDTTGQRQSYEKTLEVVLSFSGTKEVETGTTFSSRMRRQQSGDLSLIGWALLALIVAGAATFNKFKAGNARWKKLGKALAVVVVLFLAAIYLFASSAIALALATIVSILLLGKLFKEKHVVKVFEKTMAFVRKHKE